MVDVGYFINHKHGVIRNVMPISNTNTEHLCFAQVNGEEQYAIKKENIEYVIPSNIDNVGSLYTEKKTNGLCQKVDPSMTFAEKFEEVFGFEPDRQIIDDVCAAVNCDEINDCNKCPLYGVDKHCVDWDDPYKNEVK